MAKKSSIAKALRKPKYKSRIEHRCWRCGRNRGVIRFFEMCRICIREMANKGHIPGMRKSSW